MKQRKLAGGLSSLWLQKRSKRLLLRLSAICLVLQVSCVCAGDLLGPYSGNGSGDSAVTPEDGSGDFTGSGEDLLTTEAPSTQTDGEGS